MNKKRGGSTSSFRDDEVGSRFRQDTRNPFRAVLTTQTAVLKLFGTLPVSLPQESEFRRGGSSALHSRLRPLRNRRPLRDASDAKRTLISERARNSFYAPRMNVAEAQKAMNYVIAAKNPKKKLAGQTQSNSQPLYHCTYLTTKQPDSLEAD